jgi:hypothetical protein
MSQIIKPGDGFLYMKVGIHAKEPLPDIIKRKKEEIERAGFAFWGYGGNTCHPENMVQPFAKEYIAKGQTIYLCMEEMDSSHFAEPIPADEYSIDGQNWAVVPDGVRVVGSRYALVVKNLREERFDLPLAQSVVACGASQGAPGDQYIRGRVDKGCLRLIDQVPLGADPQARRIGLVAELVDPFAVYLRNRD